VYDPTWTEETHCEFPIKGLNSSLKAQFDEIETSRLRGIIQADPKPMRHKAFPSELLERNAPSIILNMAGAIPKWPTVAAYLFVGSLIQALVFALNGLVVYYWKIPRAGSAVAAYGYPLWLSGTLGITIGVALCGRVIESSTVEKTLVPSDADDGEPDLQLHSRVIWIQEKIELINLPSYAIPSNIGSAQCRISLRKRINEVEARAVLRLTLLGTLLTLCGFVCQNVATRELHWSAGILQLGTTILLTTLRGFLRRNVGNSPVPTPNALVDQIEAVQLALYLEGISVGILSEWYEHQHGGKPGQSNLASLKGLSLALQNTQNSENCRYESFSLNDERVLVPELNGLFATKIKRMLRAHEVLHRKLLDQKRVVPKDLSFAFANAFDNMAQIVMKYNDFGEFFWSPDLIAEDFSRKFMDLTPTVEGEETKDNLQAITSNLKILINGVYSTHYQSSIDAILDLCVYQMKLRHEGKRVSFDWIIGTFRGIESAKTTLERYHTWIDGEAVILPCRELERPLYKWEASGEDRAREILGLRNSIIYKRT